MTVRKSWIWSLLLGCLMVIVSACARTPVKSGMYKEASDPGDSIYSLPQMLYSLEIKKNPKDNSLHVEISSLDASPDPDYTLVAKGGHSRFFDDTLEIKTDKSGLLTSVESVGDDQTGPIIVQLSKAIKEGAKLVANFQFPASDSKAKQFENTYRKIFDPAERSEISAINADLNRLAVGFRLDVTIPANVPKPNLGVTTGIYYRRPAVYPLTIVQTSDGRPILSKQIVVPQAGPISSISIRNGRFVKTTHTMSFESGMLTEVKTSRPSEILGFVSILPETLKTIAEIPSELIQLKIDYSTREKQLLDADKKLIEAQTALKDAKDAARDRNDPPLN